MVATWMLSALALPGAAQRPDSTGKPASPAAPSSISRGRILGVFDVSSGEVIQGAEVIDLVGMDHRYTSVTGTVSLGFVRAQHDSAVVTVRKIGFRDTTFLVMLSPADTASITLVLEPVARDLDPVVTNADPNAPKDFLGFEPRCNQAERRPTCIRQDQAAAKPAYTLSELIARDGHLIRKCSQAAGDARRGRRPQTACTLTMVSAVGGRCEPTYYDGRFKTEMTTKDVDDRFATGDVKGIEVYTPESVPAAFHPNGSPPICGSVVIWSK